MVRSPSLDTAESIRAEIKPLVYALEASPYFGYVTLVAEDEAVYQDALKAYEVFSSFDFKT